MGSKHEQEFMGPGEDIFRDTSIHPGSDFHDVPVENFLNAQCKVLDAVSLPRLTIN